MVFEFLIWKRKWMCIGDKVLFWVAISLLVVPRWPISDRSHLKWQIERNKTNQRETARGHELHSSEKETSRFHHRKFRWCGVIRNPSRTNLQRSGFYSQKEKKILKMFSTIFDAYTRILIFNAIHDIQYTANLSELICVTSPQWRTLSNHGRSFNGEFPEPMQIWYLSMEFAQAVLNYLIEKKRNMDSESVSLRELLFKIIIIKLACSSALIFHGRQCYNQHVYSKRWVVR